MTNSDNGGGGLLSFGSTPAPPSGASPPIVSVTQATASKQKISAPRAKPVKHTPILHKATPKHKPKATIPETDLMDELLPKVKANLILTHDEDDALLRGHILAALGYAESYQKRSYKNEPLPPTTEQAVIMLSSHFFESRDGSTGGFFADYVGAAKQVWDAVNRLLLLEKRWEV